MAVSSAFRGKADIELKTITPGVNAGSNEKEKKFSCCIMILVTSLVASYLTTFIDHPSESPFAVLLVGFLTPVRLT